MPSSATAVHSSPSFVARTGRISSRKRPASVAAAASPVGLDGEGVEFLPRQLEAVGHHLAGLALVDEEVGGEPVALAKAGPVRLAMGSGALAHIGTRLIDSTPAAMTTS